MKLNYNNRKSEGVKLAAIVAKDLRKRIKPSTPKNEHSSAIELSLDAKHLTDAGIQAIGPALAEALNPPPGQTVTRLQTLHLQGNNLTAKCLQWLAPAMRAAAEDLELLDLSGNSICVIDDVDVSSWEAFLESLDGCVALKVLNLSGNNFANCKAWEIFARVYLRQFQNTVATCIKAKGSFDGTTKSLYNPPNAPTLSSRDTNVPRHDVRTVSRDKTSCSIISSKTIAHGLPSIPQISLAEALLNDSSALFLSWIVERHRWAQEQLLRHVWGSTQDGGAVILTTSNSGFTPAALRLLAHAETGSFRPQGTSELLDTRPYGEEDGPNLPQSRKHSPSLSVASRRVSDGSNGFGSSASSPATPTASPLEEIESLRKRAQRGVIEDHGLSRVQLWHAAIKLLTYVRHTMVERIRAESMVRKPDAQEEAEGKSRLTPGSSSVSVNLPTRPAAIPTYASKLSGVAHSPLKPMLTITPPTPTAASPQVFRTLERRRLSPLSNGPKAASNKARPNARRYERPTQMVGSMPDRACFTVLCWLADPLGLLSERQRQNVLKYGQNRRTLALETEVLGKAVSAQIWMVLDHMDCLMYDDADAGET